MGARLVSGDNWDGYFVDLRKRTVNISAWGMTITTTSSLRVMDRRKAKFRVGRKVIESTLVCTSWEETGEGVIKAKLLFTDHGNEDHEFIRKWIEKKLVRG